MQATVTRPTTYYYVAFQDIMILMSVVRRCSQTLRNGLAGVSGRRASMRHNRLMKWRSIICPFLYLTYQALPIILVHENSFDSDVTTES